MNVLPGCASGACAHYNECQYRMPCDRFDEYRGGLDDVDHEEDNEEEDTQ